MSFVVVEFVDEKAVEVVPKSWIMHKEKVSFPLKMLMVHANGFKE